MNLTFKVLKISKENIKKQPQEVFYKKRCSLKFHKLTGKHLCQSLFFNKVSGLLKKRLCHRCFPVKSAKFIRTAYLRNTYGRLLLNMLTSVGVINQSLSIKSSHSRLFCENHVLKDLAKVTGKHQYQGAFFSKLFLNSFIKK